ncbi:ATP-dependent nuclease [Desulfoscipio geothermicus]|uniref:Predicted ATP-dependent endonuclease of the OLD family, contains P-loop ATPase and TOPRIM domains n=1 Tax=Desulfoscipio geothermicus DSM 3669 TaxID=1121426 RepID=A0A1I6E8F6_9FIRM|nr:AAA family ATPase [Desulfoscipio geothermicus]SFR13996.1 Predicted ATP-dependent endonuclease of the OLD family, contains P-loop ATPase and TOPRIM domains [Desulfoscipio geothermicus DSM 3669]
MIKHVKLENFKNAVDFDTDLDKINVIVGANNSGKSSVLQGIHFNILAEAVRRNSGRETVSQHSLLYLPSSDFTVLRHGTPYTNYSGNTSKLTLTSDTFSDGENADSFSITISKGRNFENISIKCRPNNPFRQLVTSYTDLYSVYVPGLSGIPLEEKLQTKAVIRSATANGDANLYLRNILYYIKENGDLPKLNELINKIFPSTSIMLPYNPEQDLNIKVTINENGTSLPIELSGTGFLQIVQIMAYVLLFKPKLLLLDEPDEHLHPNNQLLLVDALKLLADKLNTQIIICTHSRHMLTALDDEAKFIWLKNGRVNQSNDSPYMYSVLMDIGALDTFDKVINGTYSCVFLTEDEKVKMAKRLLTYNSFNMNNTLIVPYKGCSNTETAIQLSDFIHRSAPNCKVIIHRDRDFMTDEEVSRVNEKISGHNTIPFVTDGSDIEAYFIDPSHLAYVIGVSRDEIIDWLNTLASNNHVEIQEKFHNKRKEIEYSFLYRDDRTACPSVIDLFGRTVPTASQNRLGKFMLRKANGDVFNKFGRSIDLLQNSPHLKIEQLQTILRQLQA